MFALATPLTHWHWDRFALILAACTLVPCWLFIVWTMVPQRISVGRHWLQITSTRRPERWVRTDELAQVTVRPRWTKRVLTLQDRHGRQVTVDYGDLTRDRRMFEAFLAAVRHSHSRGMKTNTMAAATLGLR